MVHESSLGWLTTFSLSLSSLSTLSLLCVFVCGTHARFLPLVYEQLSIIFSLCWSVEQLTVSEAPAPSLVWLLCLLLWENLPLSSPVHISVESSEPVSVLQERFCGETCPAEFSSIDFLSLDPSADLQHGHRHVLWPFNIIRLFWNETLESDTF